MKKKKRSELDDVFLDEEVAEFESTKRRTKSRYRLCPRCGSDKWKSLTTSKSGKAISCDECKEIDNQ